VDGVDVGQGGVEKGREVIRLLAGDNGVDELIQVEIGEECGRFSQFRRWTVFGSEEQNAVKCHESVAVVDSVSVSGEIAGIKKLQPSGLWREFNAWDKRGVPPMRWLWQESLARKGACGWTPSPLAGLLSTGAL
jgi:hypothetical protein